MQNAKCNAKVKSEANDCPLLFSCSTFHSSPFQPPQAAWGEGGPQGRMRGGDNQGRTVHSYQSRPSLRSGRATRSERFAFFIPQPSSFHSPALRAADEWIGALVESPGKLRRLRDSNPWSAI